jgi:hypothetical protein
MSKNLEKLIGELPSLEELEALRRFWEKDKTDPDFSKVCVGIVDDAIKIVKRLKPNEHPS